MLYTQRSAVGLLAAGWTANHAMEVSTVKLAGTLLSMSGAGFDVKVCAVWRLKDKGLAARSPGFRAPRHLTTTSPRRLSTLSFGVIVPPGHTSSGRREANALDPRAPHAADRMLGAWIDRTWQHSGTAVPSAGGSTADALAPSVLYSRQQAGARPGGCAACGLCSGRGTTEGAPPHQHSRGRRAA